MLGYQGDWALYMAGQDFSRKAIATERISEIDKIGDDTSKTPKKDSVSIIRKKIICIDKIRNKSVHRFGIKNKR